MPTKGDANRDERIDESLPENRLQSVIRDLEENAHRAHRRACIALLGGPLLCSEALLAEINGRADWTETRTKLLAFLRTMVRDQGRGEFSADVGLSGPVTFHASILGGGRVVCAASGDARDLVILQLVLLLEQVGLANVRECAAADCQRLFVKIYRREFCTVKCQKRANKREARRRAREEKRKFEEEQQQKQRRRLRRRRIGGR